MTTCVHSLSLFAICCPSLSFVVTRYTTRFHSLLLLVLLFVICCHLLYHLLSLLVTHYHSMYQSSVFYKRLLCALKLDRLSKEDQQSLVLEDFKATCYLKQTREILLIHEFLDSSVLKSLTRKDFSIATVMSQSFIGTIKKVLILLRWTMIGSNHQQFTFAKVKFNR